MPSISTSAQHERGTLFRERMTESDLPVIHSTTLSSCLVVRLTFPNYLIDFSKKSRISIYFLLIFWIFASARMLFMRITGLLLN
jgi:hypothetical protein